MFQLDGFSNPFSTNSTRLSEHVKTWKVVGGTDTGGILVRLGEELSSLATGRLAPGSLVKEINLKDGRLEYNLISGSGPANGWVSIKLKLKELLVMVQSPLKSEPVDSASVPNKSSVSGRLNRDTGIATFAMG